MLSSSSHTMVKPMNDPYFNFGEYYVRGDTLHYVYNNELMNSKELIQITVRTIYPRTIICADDEGRCYAIGYSEKDRIFRDKTEAKRYFHDCK